MGNLFKPQKLTTTQNASTTALQPYANAYQDLLTRGLNVSNTAYNPATNAGVAGFSDPQTQAFGLAQQNVGSYQPYLAAATGAAGLGAAPSYANVSQYMNPFDQYVTGSLLSDYDQMINRNRQMSNSDAARAGALTGDRRYVAQSIGQEGLDRALASNLAQTRQAGYTQALGASQADALRQLQATGVLSNLGAMAQQYGYNDVNAMLGVGGLQQAQQQKELDTATQNALRQSAYPFETADWAKNFATGLGGAAGSSSTGQTTQPGPSWGQQIIGAIAAAAGAAAGAKSDARIKDDIEEIGSTHDGQPIYRYRLEGSPKHEIGLLAQNVEKTHPEAVSSLGGIKHVNYKTATDDAVRGKYALGGGMPYGGGLSYVPQIQMQPFKMAQAQFVQAAKPESGMSKILDSFNSAHGTIKGLGKLGESLSTPISSSKDNDSGWTTSVSKSGWMPWLGNQASNLYGGLSNLASSAYGGLSGLGKFVGLRDGGVVRHGYQFGGVPGAIDYQGSPFDYMPMSYVPDNADINKNSPIVRIDQNAVSPEEFYNSGIVPKSEPPTRIVDTAPVPPDSELLTTSSIKDTAPPSSGLSGLTQSAPSDEESASLFGYKMSPEAADALMAAGFGMMASNSPFPLQAAGEGGLAGLGYYTRAMKEKRERDAGKVIELGGDIVKVTPDNKVQTLYKGPKAAFQSVQKLDDGTILGITKDGMTQVIYGGGDVVSDKTPRGRASLAERYGYAPGTPEYNAYVLTGKLPKEDEGKLTVTDKKAILEADDMVQTNRAAIDSLKNAIIVSEKANQGVGASARAWLGSNLPSITPESVSTPESSAATIDLDNIVIGTALSQLKSIFGAAPTEGERKILLDLQGSSSLPHASRVKIYKRAIELAERRLRFNEEKASQLRGGTYYQNRPETSGSPSPNIASSSPSNSSVTSVPMNLGEGFSGGFEK